MLFLVGLVQLKGFGALCTYQQTSQGVDPGDIRGNSAGFADFYRLFLAQDRGIGLLFFALLKQDTRGKTHRICNIATILKMKDLDRRDWVSPLNGKKRLRMFLTLSPV